MQMTLPSSPTSDFTTAGRATSNIPVRIGYRIVELFSDGLYSSPNKAIEELVSNSFDAGAPNVHVLMSPDRTNDDAVIVVVDDGVSMNADGLRQHWLIGESNKRTAGIALPRGRKQIGKFGIGKLATFVLANHLTHLCKIDDKYFAATMDYTRIEQKPGGLQPEQEIKLALRELTEAEAIACMPSICSGEKPGHKAIQLFGSNAAKTWTVAVMSKLKPMAREIRKRHLAWVLRTAMPLRDDFALYLDGDQLMPSKLDAKVVKRWVIGQDLTELPKPAPDDLEVTEDSTVGSLHRFGLTHSSLGRITGYAEIYENLITGQKSDEIGRSNGFFIYVRDRLVNIDDERFGIDPDKLRHGTFARFRAVVHIDRLDQELRSTREAVREGPLTTLARQIVHALFNIARATLQQHDDEAKPGAHTKGRIQQAPGSLTRRPMAGMLRLALSGNISPRYIKFTKVLTSEQQEKYLEDFRTRSEGDEGLVREVRQEYLSSDAGLAIFDVDSGALLINDLHPFVAANRDDYEKAETLPLLAMAEILTEAYLYQAGLKPNQVDEILKARDELLRQFARSARRSASLIAQMLEEASHDKEALERELVAAFDSMGFEAVRIGGSDKPDGVATAHLAASEGRVRRYKVSLEAKSKERDGTKISARGVAVAALARHRKDHGCDHAVVVCQEFQLGKGEELGAVIKEAQANKAETGKTITLVRLRDMARLVRLVPMKGIGLDGLRDLFATCTSPEESQKWIEALDAARPAKAEFKRILETIWALQGEQPDEPIEFGALRFALRRDQKIDLPKQEIMDLCRAVERIAPNYIKIRDEKIELVQRPDKIVEAAGAALQQFPDQEAKRSIFRL